MQNAPIRVLLVEDEPADDPEMGQVKLLVDGGVRMIQKPFDPDLLLRAIRAALDAQHLPEASRCLI